jgi:nucleosome binding factor SPN SPT16 subunit
MEKEAILLPINGRSVPFHISTIKNISMPEQDRATWMRINFFIPGVALGKDVAKNIQQLVRNAPSLCIILLALFLTLPLAPLSLWL